MYADGGLLNADWNAHFCHIQETADRRLTKKLQGQDAQIEHNKVRVSNVPAVLSVTVLLIRMSVLSGMHANSATIPVQVGDYGEGAAAAEGDERAGAAAADADWTAGGACAAAAGAAGEYIKHTGIFVVLVSLLLASLLIADWNANSAIIPVLPRRSPRITVRDCGD